MSVDQVEKKELAFSTNFLVQDDLEPIELNCSLCEQEYESVGYFDEELECYIDLSPTPSFCGEACYELYRRAV